MIDYNKERPEWQENRGPRHGNNRKLIAKRKWRHRKDERVTWKRETSKEVDNWEN
jgi:hypothetical protein